MNSKKQKKNNLLRILRAFVLILLPAVILCGCGTQPEPEKETGGKIKIVAAIFPAWDWTRNVLGENPAGAELTLLVKNGVDLHSFQPSAADILTISGADLFIYVGGESDRWVTDALKQAQNPNMRVLKMLDTLGDSARTEETVEGMQDEEQEETTAYDEHVWLSLRNAAILTDAITGELTVLDPGNAENYKANAAAYKEKLTELDSAYVRVVSEAPLHTLLFGDRFPFRYLTEDYGLNYYAAFSGCSAETEASFETITFLAGKCDELSLPALLTIDGSDGRIAETIVQASADKSRQILSLDSMQSVSGKDIEAGTSYLSIMESNLSVLEQALGGA